MSTTSVNVNKETNTLVSGVKIPRGVNVEIEKCQEKLCDQLTQKRCSHMKQIITFNQRG